MRRADLPEIVTALEPPVAELVREARLRMALLVRGSGQVLAQYGFTRSYEVMNVASLAAAAHASSRALAQMIGRPGWGHLHQSGRDRSLFMAPIATPAEELIIVAIFDGASSLGIVQFFFERFSRCVAELPVFQIAGPGTDEANFEMDLEAGLTPLTIADGEIED